jgi:hypothetical protein
MSSVEKPDREETAPRDLSVSFLEWVLKWLDQKLPKSSTSTMEKSEAETNGDPKNVC